MMVGGQLNGMYGSAYLVPGKKEMRTGTGLENRTDIFLWKPSQRE